jgi:hypothetical protein
MKTKLSILSLLAASIAFTAGCASQQAPGVEFGSAVRAVTRNQIYDPIAAVYPEEKAVTGGNADRLEKVVEAHSGSVSDANSVRTPQKIGIGSN